MNKYIKKLMKKVNNTKIPYFVFIGTTQSYIDGIAPRLGTRLKDKYKILGDVEHNLDAKTIDDNMNTIKSIDTSIYQIIAVDCAFHENYNDRDMLIILDNIAPRSYLNSTLPKIGDFGIGINVSKHVGHISEFLTGTEREDIKNLENKIYDIFEDLICYYPTCIRIAQLHDIGKSKKEIMSDLSLNENKYIKELININSYNTDLYNKRML